MSSFEEEIRARTADNIANQQALAASMKEERDRIAAEIAENDANKLRLAEQAMHIGSQAVSLLVDAGWPTLPVWGDVKYGKSITEMQSSLSGPRKVSYRKTTLDIVGQGWHILTSEYTGDYENPSSKSYYALTKDGVFGRFDNTLLSNYYDGRDNGKRKEIKGIIRLREERYEGPRLRELESDRFKNALAYYLETGRTFIDRH